MQELLALIRAKIGREAKTLGCATTSADCSDKSSNISSNAKAAKTECWLCAYPARFHLVVGFDLCFSCFRRALLVCVLPLINTPQRRESDASFISKILELRDEKKEASLSTGELTRTSKRMSLNTVEVTHPSQANFVMSSSVMRQRCSIQQSVDTCIRTGEVISRTEEFWTCPQCTYLNDGGVRLCVACHFHNIGTVICPFCNALCRMGEERVSQCVVKKALHLVWSCSTCSIVNTVDADECCMCRVPLIWACARCTAQQESRRTTEGLRVCRTCGSYNTPMEVIQSRLAMDWRQNRSTEQPDVEFGVNDAETIAEKTRQRDISESKERLAQRMQQLGIQHVNVQMSDGNCLFRALSSQLFGRPDSHMLVRSLIVGYMRERADSYKVLFDGEEEWRTYLRNMRRAGFWGDELCLNAAARCFHANIHVITSGTMKWHLVFQHEELSASHSLVDVGDNEANRRMVSPSTSSMRTRNNICLFLVYMAPVHYDDVMPLRASVVHDLSRDIMNVLQSLLEEEKSCCDSDEDGEMRGQLVERKKQQKPREEGEEEGEVVVVDRLKGLQLPQQNQLKCLHLEPPSSRSINTRKLNRNQVASADLTHAVKPPPPPPPPPSLPSRKTHSTLTGSIRRIERSKDAADGAK